MKYSLKDAYNFLVKGNLQKAKKITENYLIKNPKDLNALQILSAVFFQSKDFENAKLVLERLIEINSSNAQIHNNYALALFNLSEFENALACLNKAIKIDKNYAEAYYNRGNVFLKLQNRESALKSFDHAIELKPDYKIALNNKGNLLKDIGKLDEALLSYQKAIKIKPINPDEINNCGNIYFEMERYDDALNYFTTAIKINPNFYQAHYNLGKVLNKLGNKNKAIESYKNSIQINDKFERSFFNLGSIYLEQKNYSEAKNCFEKVLDIKPNQDFLLGNIFYTNASLCDWSKFENFKEELENKIHDGQKVCMPFHTLALTNSPELQKIASETYFKSQFKKIKREKTLTFNYDNKKIKVGYYSADFHSHATMYLIANLFELHDKDKFEIIGFSYGRSPKDEMNSRVKNAFDHFFDVSEKTDKEIANFSRDLKIDIAVDLKGYTRDNRFGIFVERCSPIQVSYLGYPGTLGSNCIDYIIADKIIIPKDSEKFYSEKIIYMPDTYQVNDPTIKIDSQKIKKENYGLPDNKFIFCSFNQNYKITPSVYNIWIKILKETKDSIIWILSENNKSRENLLEKLNLSQIDRDRLIFAEKLSHKDHLYRLKLADLFLDTFPCNAHTTASDALRSGVPVLTYKGKTFASRVATSLNYSFGLNALVAKDEKEYLDLAVEIGNNREKSLHFKKIVNKNLDKSSLFNIKSFTKNLEKAYVKIYENYKAGMQAENLFIE